MTAPVIEFIDPLLLNVGDTVFLPLNGQNPKSVIPPFDESSVIAKDNCSGNVVITFRLVLISEGNFPGIPYVRLFRLEWTATDDCGNSSSEFKYIAYLRTGGQNHAKVVPVENVLSTISDISDMSKDNLNELTMWPNPVSETVNVSFEAASDFDVNFMIVNFLGHVEKLERISARKGFNSYKVDVSQLTEGSYMLKFQTNNEIHSKVIVIMR
jgi:hypothetical protein